MCVGSIEFTSSSRQERARINWNLSLLSKTFLSLRCQQLIIDSRFCWRACWLHNVHTERGIVFRELFISGSVCVLSRRGRKFEIILVISLYWSWQNSNYRHVTHLQVRSNSISNGSSNFFQLFESCSLNHILNLGFFVV